MHNMLVKYSAWSTAQDLQCPCSHSLVQNECTIYKVESLVATSTAKLVQCPMSMQSHIECDCMDIGHCTNWAVDVASDSTL